MFVRVHDSENGRYYKSVSYGQLDIGWFEYAIVLDPYADRFRLVRYLEKVEGGIVPVFEVIQPERADWVEADKAELLRSGLQSEGRPVEYFSGYADVVGNLGFLARLLAEGSVGVSEAGVQLRGLPDAQEWNYIATQEDADAFMELFAGFHDSLLNKLVYEEDCQIRKVTAIFDNTAWYGVAELCFEGLVAMNLRPSQENYDNYIMGGTLIVKDECIFWADDWLKEEDLSHTGSYIKALNLKWRKIG